LQDVLFLVHLAALDLKINVQFFRSALGNEPVREWLKGLAREERYLIGMEIKTVQLGWPLGMPLVRKLEHGLWEIRIDMGHVVARVLFTIMDGVMFMLHGLIKKSQKTPSADLALARQRKASLRRSTI